MSSKTPLDAVSVVGVGDVGAVPSQKKIDTVDPRAGDMKRVVYRLLWNDSIPEQFLRNPYHWLADHKQRNVRHQFQSLLSQRLVSARQLIQDDLR